MKKIAMFIAAVAMAVSASAQQKTALVGQKWSDNIYIGGALGLQAKSNNGDLKPSMSGDPNLTFIIGKNFDPIFGLRIEAEARMDAHTKASKVAYYTPCFVNGLDINLLTTWNMMNIFGGYKGQPRPFEVSLLYGFGWGHVFGSSPRINCVLSKVGVDFSYNFGNDKQYQVFFEPSLTYDCMRWYNGNTTDAFQYNLSRANLDLKFGFIYKFKCSNGKHNFSYDLLRDQSEIDALNNSINGLRGDLANAKAAEAAAAANVANLQKLLLECQNKPVTVINNKAANLQPSVVFRQGKSVVDASQLANVDMVAKYMKNNKDCKVKISGYASPEGSKELNQKLSEKRAAAVKKILVKKYKIAANRIETEGLGATDKLFDEVEFNRVALFNDTTK